MTPFRCFVCGRAASHVVVATRDGLCRDHAADAAPVAVLAPLAAVVTSWELVDAWVPRKLAA